MRLFLITRSVTRRQRISPDMGNSSCGPDNHNKYNYHNHIHTKNKVNHERKKNISTFNDNNLNHRLLMVQRPYS